MAQTSYRESDAEWEGIRASQARAEKNRRESLTWEQRVIEADHRELFKLENELRKLHAIAAKIPDMEALIRHHREKMAKFKELYA